MQYQVDLPDQSPENSQKPHFWTFGSFKKAFLRSLYDPSWPGNIAESWKTFSTITICNIKAIQHTKLKKMAKNLFFGYLDHSKRHFLWCLNDPAWRIWQSTCQDHLVESKYAIWSLSDAPNSRKWSKTSFLAIWIIQKGIFCDVWMIQHGVYDSLLVKII